MRTKLRPYQEEIKSKVYEAWQNGARNVMLVMPTGAGKTRTFCSITIDKAFGFEKLPTAIMVHRKELVQQISLTLAEEGILHNIIAPQPVIKGIISAQRRVLNKAFYDYKANVTVLSVDTLNSRIQKHENWAKGIRLFIVDEAAHVLKENKWGQATSYFQNAIGLGVTATPQRLDKRGLGSHVDGIFDAMVEGPTSKWLIDQGFLSKYKVAVPQSDYEMYLKKAHEGSDYTRSAMAEASAQSAIVGDVVANYQKWVNGKQAIVFASDIESAGKMEKRFRDSGITAKLLTGETADKERLDSLIEYREKKIAVLINVDLFDEGLDVPGIESVIMARPTMSLGKYLQMAGRGLRPASDKPYTVIIDHVGNVRRHGLPCEVRKWTLDRIVKRRDRVNLVRICANPMCNAPYDRALTECPYCGTLAVTQTRSGGESTGRASIKEIDGDLALLDPDTLREMEKDAVLEDPGALAERVARAAGAAAGLRAAKLQRERIETQKRLAEVIAKWAGYQKRSGYSDRSIHKKFFLEFDMSITYALGQPRAEMESMLEDLDSRGFR